MNIRAALIASALLLSASVASAVPTFTLISPATVSIGIGGMATIDVALDNPGGDTVQGVTGTITGIDPAIATFDGGETAEAHFVAVCLALPTGCLGGINTVNNQFFNPSDLAFGYTPGADNVTVVSSLGISPTVNVGTLDPGLDGDLLTPSVRDVSVDFTGVAMGSYVITIGGNYSDGSSTIPAVGTTVTINVPEPVSTTASLAGLGAVLAVVGIRRRQL